METLFQIKPCCETGGIEIWGSFTEKDNTFEEKILKAVLVLN